MAQVIEHLPNKDRAQSSSPSTTENDRQEGKTGPVSGWSQW
jgi:hypothetical protein